MDHNLLTVGLAQIAPVWLDRERTLAKVNTYVEDAAKQGCHLVVFGEALVPGYPFWMELTDGARFNSPTQKAIFAEYAAHRDELLPLIQEYSPIALATDKAPPIYLIYSTAPAPP